MEKIFRTLLGFGLLLTSTEAGFGQSNPAPNDISTPEIVVRVHDYVQVPPETLMGAETVASGILRDAGVSVVWINCDYAIVAGLREPACRQPRGAQDLVLNLVDRIQPLSPKLPEIAMGLAVVPFGGKKGDLVYLSMQQATSIANDSSIPLGTLLGLGAAHELGHLLLGENAHAPDGLMKARWSSEELELGSRGKLLFNATQSNRIRRNLVAWEKKASSSAIATAVGPDRGIGL